MKHPKQEAHRQILERVAWRAMLDRGLLPDFSEEALEELNLIREPSKASKEALLDLRNLLWASIDNDDSRDLDQLTVGEPLPDRTVRILVAIADVDQAVRKDSAIDHHARQNTTSVYTAAKIFPMLPERLSTDLTSLNYSEDRVAVVVEIVLSDNGTVKSSDIYRAWVRNRAKLA